MRLVPTRLEAHGGGRLFSAAVNGDGAFALGPVEIELAIGASWPSFSWAVANHSDRPVALRSVSLFFDLADAHEPVRMFRNGYQSWSPSATATFGVDFDPSTRARFEFLQAAHHADQRVVESPDELRSEWVTLLGDAAGGLMLVGFTAGTEHDGTFRLRRASGGAGIELGAEAFLGDAVLGPGEQRHLHGIVSGGEGVAMAAPELLDRWASFVGQAGGARIDGAYQVGWCSWYHYFDAITEPTLAANLSLGGDWPLAVFQLDDGYQSAIGDWLTTNDKFPSGLAAVADAILAAGRRPGLWLAPFLAAPDSRLAGEHPGWFAAHGGSDGSRRALYPWWNPAWGGGRDGFMYGLDTTNPEVLTHLESLARSLVEMGFTYLKLDFTFAPGVDGVWADPTLTPAQRVRAGFAALRRGAGDDAFLVGCGVPLSHVVGLVDANRIGQDVAPLWALDQSAEVVPGYLAAQPATSHAYGNTVARSFMHRRLWLNDPDCLMLRTTQTALSAPAARTWARVVGLSGGMALVSDDLALLDSGARAMLDEVVALGRASDDAARAGLPAVATDLMMASPPARFVAAGYTLVTETSSGSSTLTRSA